MPVDNDPLDPVLAEAVRDLRDRAPATDLWPAIAPRLVMRRPRGSVLMRWPTALAAGITIAIVSAGGTMMVVKNQRTNGGIVDAGPAIGVSTVPVAYSSADSTLDHAIRDLENSLHATLPSLDLATRAGIERSLTSLNNAIADAHSRQAADPTDPKAERYLTSTLRRKLDVLRTVSTLTARRG